MNRTPLLGVVALLALAVPAFGQTPVLKTTAQGNPGIKSIQSIGFAPGGVLLIGDGTGGQVVAVETGDTTAKNWTSPAIQKIDELLAARLGTTAKNIEIVKMAVNPVSMTPYIAVRLIEGKKSLVMTVSPDGKANEFSLDNVKYARIKLDTGDTSKVTLITDVAFASDRILAATQANDKTFGSRIVSVGTPVENDVAVPAVATETYHVAHGKWETAAPIRVVIPYEEAGKRYLVGAFTCTPLVKYTLDDLKPNAKIKGESVYEAGQGNEPRDMFVYEKGGKKYILVSTIRKFGKPFGSSKYWTFKLDFNVLAEKTKINTTAERRDVKANQYMIAAYDGVSHMDLLDRERAMVIRDNGKGNLSLEALALP
jgi:hypothetical protein